MNINFHTKLWYKLAVPNTKQPGPGLAWSGPSILLSALVSAQVPVVYLIPVSLHFSSFSLIFARHKMCVGVWKWDSNCSSCYSLQFELLGGSRWNPFNVALLRFFLILLSSGVCPLEGNPDTCVSAFRYNHENHTEQHLIGCFGFQLRPVFFHSEESNRAKVQRGEDDAQ